LGNDHFLHPMKVSLTPETLHEGRLTGGFQLEEEEREKHWVVAVGYPLQVGKHWGVVVVGCLVQVGKHPVVAVLCLLQLEQHRVVAMGYLLQGVRD
jgi:hypothetical protein